MTFVGGQFAGALFAAAGSAGALVESGLEPVVELGVEADAACAAAGAELQLGGSTLFL